MAKRSSEGKSRFETHVAKRGHLGDNPVSSSSSQPCLVDAQNKRHHDEHESQHDPKHKQHRKSDVVGSKRDRYPEAAREEPPSKMQGFEDDEIMDEASPDVNLVAIELFRSSPCELDHVVYDA